MFKNVATVALAVSLIAIPGVNALASNNSDEAIEVRSESVKFETRVVEDKNLPKGVEITTQEGKDGEKTFFKSFKNLPSATGAMTSVPVYYDELTELPVEKVVRKGTKTLVIDGTSEKTIQLETEKREKKEKEECEKLEKQEREKQEKLISERIASAALGQGSNVQLEYTGGGTKEDWMKEAGIDESDWKYVDYIVNKESGWNPNAVNSSSGATGLCQALPGNKMASAGDDWMSNPVTQLKWCDSYAKQRYSGWENSYNAWISKNWW